MAGVKGRSGRKPKPNRDDSRQVQATPGTPAKPDWLSDYSSNLWDKMLALFEEHLPQLLSVIDSDVLAIYCDAWEDFLKAKKIMELQGDYIGARKHPAHGVKKIAGDRIESCMRKLGLSPQDRATMRIDPPTSDEIDPLLKLARSYETTTRSA